MARVQCIVDAHGKALAAAESHRDRLVDDLNNMTKGRDAARNELTHAEMDRDIARHQKGALMEATASLAGQLKAATAERDALRVQVAILEMRNATLVEALEAIKACCIAMENPTSHSCDLEAICRSALKCCQGT